MPLLTENLLLICNYPSTFVKDQAYLLANDIAEMYILIRTNPLINIARYLNISAFEISRFELGTIFKDRPANINVFNTPVKYFPTDSGYRNLGEKHLKSVETMIRRYKFEFDIIHSHFIWSSGYVGARLKEECDVPFILTAHGYDIYDLPFRDEDWKEKIQYVLNSANCIITVSNSNLNLINELRVKSPIKIIPNGFNTRLFYPMDLYKCREKLDLPLNKKIILAVGNLLEVKGHQYLIKAMAKIKHERDLLCIFVGSGDCKKKLEGLIKKHCLEKYVRIIDARPHNEIAIWINACDVFVLPSLSEGNPTVMFESLGCGKSFVGTRVGGIPEIIINDKLGILVDPGDPEALALAILQALDTEWDAEYIREYAQQFTLERIAKQVMDAYESVMNR